jgi:hypothetical protein
LADIEEKNITPEEETEAERPRRKDNKHKAMSLFKAELRRQAEDKVQTLKELKTEELRRFREQNTRNRTELRAEVTPEELIQVKEKMRHTKQEQERGVRCDWWVQRMASSSSFKNKSIVITYLQWKKYASFAKLLNGYASTNICCPSGKLCTHRFMIFHKISDSYSKSVF